MADATDGTNLPDGCCDAIYLRTMLQHGVTPEEVVSAFTSVGCALRHRDNNWGGPTFLLLFECVK